MYGTVCCVSAGLVLVCCMSVGMFALVCLYVIVCVCVYIFEFQWLTHVLKCIVCISIIKSCAMPRSTTLFFM